MSFQFSGRHGQAIQQPACAAHSGGMKKPASRGVATLASSPPGAYRTGGRGDGVE